MEKDHLCNKWCWEYWTVTCKSIKLDYSFTPRTKINSKSIKYLNVNPEVTKHLEENISNMILEISVLYFWIHLFREGKQKQK